MLRCSLPSVCVFVFALHSQVLTGVISGTVTDATQAVVPNAPVTVVNADTGVTQWRGAANDSAVYRAPGLPVGRYNVSVQAQASSARTSPASASPWISVPASTSRCSPAP